MHFDPGRTQRRFLDFLGSREGDAYIRDLLPRPPRVRYVAAAFLALTGAGIPIALGLLVSAARSHRGRAEQRAALIEAARRSVPMITCVLMSNRALSERPGVTAPALVIGATDLGPVGDLPELAFRLSMTFETGGVGADEIAPLFEDEAYTPGRRRKVPGRFTEGREVLAFDLLVQGRYLPGGKLDHPAIPCLVEPGPTGQILMIPADLMAEAEVLEDW